jgi:hypothetical protein
MSQKIGLCTPLILLNRLNAFQNGACLFFRNLPSVWLASSKLCLCEWSEELGVIVRDFVGESFGEWVS